MDPHNAHGRLRAFEALGLTKQAAVEEIVKEIAQTHPSLVLGLLIGAGIGLHAMYSKERRKRAIPYRLEGNPLYYPQYSGASSDAHAKR